MNRYEFYGNINTYRKNQTNKENELTHYGTLGQKWGVRRWQNPDGTFNEAGKKRYFGTKKSESKLSSKAADIYKNYKPNEWNIGLNKSNLSSKEWYKLKTEMNNKLYSEDKKFSKIINDKDVQNAMLDYINVRNEVNKEEKRVFSEEFRNSNPKARDFDGDAWEYWHEFADPNIIRKNDETYKNLKEAITKKSTKNMGFTSDLDTMNKVVSDIKEACERGKDSDKIYDLVKENMGIDFRNNEEKIGSSWKSMSDQDYAQVEKDMKKSGWDTDKELKPGNQVYSKPIDNDDYKGIKYEVDAYKFHDNSVDDINKKYQEHINFLNKKDSLKQVLDNFADYEYPYYEKYINNHNKYFDNKLDVISKTEFINAVKSNINLNKTGLSWNNELYMQFVPKENKDFNYFKDMYDVFTVDVDPKSGKVSDFTIV